uniref:UCR_hinge domain-containing protein n=1 Tax=Globodera pallida TaxID=36090 RepID=A0A183CA09_GLOPA
MLKNGPTSAMDAALTEARNKIIAEHREYCKKKSYDECEAAENAPPERRCKRSMTPDGREFVCIPVVRQVYVK